MTLLYIRESSRPSGFAWMDCVCHHMCQSTLVMSGELATQSIAASQLKGAVDLLTVGILDWFDPTWDS